MATLFNSKYAPPYPITTDLVAIEIRTLMQELSHKYPLIRTIPGPAFPTAPIKENLPYGPNRKPTVDTYCDPLDRASARQGAGTGKGTLSAVVDTLVDSVAPGPIQGAGKSLIPTQSTSVPAWSWNLGNFIPALTTRRTFAYANRTVPAAGRLKLMSNLLPFGLNSDPYSAPVKSTWTPTTPGMEVERSLFGSAVAYIAGYGGPLSQGGTWKGKPTFMTTIEGWNMVYVGEAEGEVRLLSVKEIESTVDDLGVIPGEIYAYRSWCAEVDSTAQWPESNGTISPGSLLTSIYKSGVVWPTDAPMSLLYHDAVSTYDDHSGVHAFKTIDHLISYHDGMSMSLFENVFYGGVKLWGRVVEHEAGYRAEFAKPVWLTAYGKVPCKEHNLQAKRLQQTYGVGGIECLGNEPAVEMAKFQAKLAAQQPRHLG